FKATAISDSTSLQVDLSAKFDAQLEPDCKFADNEGHPPCKPNGKLKRFPQR
ncbi:hypothetical protein AVEN_142932-1, partial [Araneus ventricosus]